MKGIIEKTDAKLWMKGFIEKTYAIHVYSIWTISTLLMSLLIEMYGTKNY